MPNGVEPPIITPPGDLRPEDFPSLPDKPGECDTPIFKDNPFWRKAGELYNDMHAFLKCKTGHSLLSFLGAAIGFVLFSAAGLLTGLIVSTLAKISATVAASMLEMLGEVRQEAAPDLNEVIIATLNEMFGTQFTTEDLPTKGDFNAAKDRANRIGQKVISVLEGEFSPTGEISPTQGRDAAQTFTGFTVNFSVVSAFIAILGEMVSGGQMESFRELGVEMAQNLGLGRMSRRGLSELVSTTVATPYEWYLNKKYRPTRFGPTEAVRAMLARHFTPDQAREEMEMAGWSGDRISALIESHSKDLSVQQLKILFTAGRLNQDDFELLMGRQGWTPELTQRWTEAELLFEARSNAITIARRVLDDVVNGIVSPDEYETMMSRLNLAKVEIEGFRAQAGELSRLPRRTLTLGQMRQAFIDGIVDVSEWQDYLIRQGYGRDDRQILTLQVLLDAKQQAEADALRKERERERQERRQAQAAKSQTPPPTP